MRSSIFCPGVTLRPSSQSRHVAQIFAAAYRPCQRWLVALLATLGVCALATPQAVAKIERGYVTTHIGQLHFYRVTPPESARHHIPVVLFHPSPRSGQLYQHLMEDLGRDRVVIAFDTPGFGASDPFVDPPTMTDIGAVMAEALEKLGYGGRKKRQVDLFGFHTGTFIAAEVALGRPSLVRRVVLSGIAWRAPDDRKALFDAVNRDPQLDRNKIDYAWQSTIESRDEGVTFEEAKKSFAENVKALSGKYWHAYHAVWAYPVDDRLPKITQPVLVLNYAMDTEYDATSEAHRRLLPKAPYVELKDVTATFYPFTPQAAAWANALRNWLDKPVGK